MSKEPDDLPPWMTEAAKKIAKIPVGLRQGSHWVTQVSVIIAAEFSASRSALPQSPGVDVDAAKEAFETWWQNGPAISPALDSRDCEREKSYAWQGYAACFLASPPQQPRPAQQPQSVAEDEERAKFERWVNEKKYGPLYEWKHSNGIYEKPHVQFMWEAWQARAAAPLPQPAGDGVDVDAALVELRAWLCDEWDGVGLPTIEAMQERMRGFLVAINATQGGKP